MRRKRFGITNVVFVGDRGMITTKRINEVLRDVDGLEWISALRTEGIRSLMDAGKISRSLFDEKDLAEITDEELFPGERLIVCRNPLLADERARKRDALRELIFDDDDTKAAQATRKSVVAKAQRSKSAKQKDATRRPPDDLPVQSF